MNLRTQLIAAIVGVALGGGVLFAAFTYIDAAQTLERAFLKRVDAVAEAKAQQLRQLLDSWAAQTRSVAAVTPLRAGIDAYFAEPSTRHVELSRLDRMLEDLLAATPALKRITVYDRTGEPATSVGEAAIAAADAVPPARARTTRRPFTAGENGAIEAVYQAPLVLEDRNVGALEVVFDGAGVGTIATSASDALGDEAVTHVVARTDAGIARLTALAEPGNWRNDAAHVVAAVEDEPAAFANVLDHRGTEVVVATRKVAGIDWGVVVQAPRSIATQTASALRDRLVMLAIALGAGAFAAALWLAGRIATARGTSSTET